MKYEAKHSYFKGLAQAMGNFYNNYSLAMHYQSLQCYYNATDTGNQGTWFVIGPGMLHFISIVHLTLYIF